MLLSMSMSILIYPPSFSSCRDSSCLILFSWKFIYFKLLEKEKKMTSTMSMGIFFGLNVDEPNTRPDLPICGNFTLAHKADHWREIVYNDYFFQYRNPMIKPHVECHDAQRYWDDLCKGKYQVGRRDALRYSATKEFSIWGMHSVLVNIIILSIIIFVNHSLLASAQRVPEPDTLPDLIQFWKCSGSM